MSRDSFNPNVYTVEQQREPFEQRFVTEFIRDALRSEEPSLLSYAIDPATGEPLFPVLARKVVRSVAG